MQNYLPIPRYLNLYLIRKIRGSFKVAVFVPNKVYNVSLYDIIFICLFVVEVLLHSSSTQINAWTIIVITVWSLWECSQAFYRFQEVGRAKYCRIWFDPHVFTIRDREIRYLPKS